MTIDTDDMQLAHLADVHLGHRQYGLKQREDDMASTFKHTLGAIDGVDAVLLPGDLFHSRDLRPKNLDDAGRILRDRIPDDVPVLVSRGNHDENLSPRNVTWLDYLHRRGYIVLLEADLESDPETAQFSRYDSANPDDRAGFIDLPAGDDAVRVFGLQWRGARTAEALSQVARGIRATNERHGEPAYTVLLGHFGMEDEVPALGGTITHGDLREVREVVDYLALGHIHKRYDAADWIYNPGSPEAHTTREGRDDWEHGYYTVDLTDDGSGALTHETTHHATKRRPSHRIEFDVTPYDSPGDLETAFREHIEDEREAIEQRCAKDIHSKKGGRRRKPLIDLRFTGTLQFSRSDLRTGDLAAWAEDAYEALYVQTTTGVRTADVQALLSELDEEVFVDGKLNTTALERRVFETIATESEYSEHTEAVADVLERAHTMTQHGETTADVVDVISDRRRELFPELSANANIDVPESPFEDAEESTTSESNSQLGEPASTDGGEAE